MQVDEPIPAEKCLHIASSSGRPLLGQRVGRLLSLPGRVRVAHEVHLGEVQRLPWGAAKFQRGQAARHRCVRPAAGVRESEP